jgi:hypothetical protein
MILGCEKPHNSRGFCQAHYALWKKYGTPTPDTSYGKGYITSGGYRKICINGKMIFEHRHVMEVVLSRPLTREEVVHHKDRNKLNNVPDNLEVLTQTVHMGKHGGRQPLPTTTPTHRRCPQCGLIKLRTEFGTTTRRSYCRVCWSTYYVNYRILHPRDASTFRRG